MKTKRTLWLLLPLGALLMQGCIAFPPLIQVEHKENPVNQPVVQRLDSIEKRLDALEQKVK